MKLLLTCLLFFTIHSVKAQKDSILEVFNNHDLPVETRTRAGNKLLSISNRTGDLSMFKSFSKIYEAHILEHSREKDLARLYHKIYYSKVSMMWKFNFFNARIESSEHAKDSIVHRESLLMMAFLYFKISDFDKMEELLVQADQEFQKSSDYARYIEFLNSGAYLLSNASLPARSLSFLRRANGLIDDSVPIRFVLENYQWLGIVHSSKKPDSAKYYFQHQINLAQKHQKHGFLANAYRYSAYPQLTKKNYATAQQYLDSSLIHFQNIGNRNRETLVIAIKAHIYLLEGKDEEAFQAYNSLYNYDEAPLNKGPMLEHHYEAYEFYRNRNQNSRALRSLEYYNRVKKRINIESSKREIANKKFQDEISAITAEQDMNQKMHRVRETKLLAENKLKQRTLWFSLLGLLLLLGALVVTVRYSRKKTKMNALIVSQKSKLEDAHQNITDSIRYAQKIQNALLPLREKIKVSFKHSFLLFKPKEDVSGDFFWLHTNGDKNFVAIGDCTGHGVPGSLVSILCINALNRSVREYRLDSPADILNKTRTLISEELNQRGEIVRDGMDISLCAIEGKRLTFSGANHSIYLQKKQQVVDVKGNKQHIGYSEQVQLFDNHTLDLGSGDRLFLFTDGFADQFGGPKNKKLKRSGMKQFILEQSEQPIDHLEESFDKFFEEWKGSEEQIDDVSVLGIEF